MVKETKFKMSQDEFDKLKQEQQYLQTVRDKEVKEQLKEARSFGDLSENSEYDEAKTEQGKLFSRIAELQNLIDNAEIIEVAENTGIIGIGSKVTVRDLEDGSIEIYSIGGSREADPAANKISDDSPLGTALLGHGPGEIVHVDAPVGRLEFEIISID